MRPTHTATALVAVVAVIGVVAVPAAAGHADAPFADRLLGVDDNPEMGTINSILVSIRGLGGRLQARGAAFLTPGEPDPEAAMDATIEFFNRHNESFEAFADANLEQRPNRTVLKVTYIVDDERATGYLVGRPTASGYTAVRMQETRRRNVASYVRLESGSYLVQYANGATDTVASLNHSVDDTLTVRGWAVGHATAELKRFHSRFVDGKTDVPQSYFVRAGARYAPAVNSTWVGNS